MKLSYRLKAIADLVPKESKIIDIGADHALLDIYLALNKKCTSLALDISAKAIEKAKENILKAGANVKTLVNDGINGLNLKDEILIISGMGTSRILKILNRDISNDLIISTHNDVLLLRRTMLKKGYSIYKEKVIKDKKFYVITYYKKMKFNKNIYSFNSKEYSNHLIDYYKIKYKNEPHALKKLKILLLINKLKRNS